MKPLLFFTCILFFACTKQDTLTVLDYKGNAIAISVTNDKTTFDLVKGSADMGKLSWNSPDYGYASSSTYVLQFDLKSRNFADMTQIDSLIIGNKKTFELDNNSVNKVAQNLGLKIGASGDLVFRIVSYLPTVIPVYSASMDLRVNNVFSPFNAYVLMGNYNNNALDETAKQVVSVDDNSKFEGFMTFDKVGSFSLTNDKGVTKWGKGATANTLVKGGTAIDIPTTGFYVFVGDTLTGLYVFEKITAWAIIGDAYKGWKEDLVQLMTDKGQGTYEALGVSLIAGKMKLMPIVKDKAVWGAAVGTYGQLGYQWFEYGIGGTSIVGEAKIKGYDIYINTAGSYDITLKISQSIPGKYNYSVKPS